MNYKDLDKSSLSPMMQRYYETKAEYEDAILMYRLGDFYEMFFEDAEKASRELELTLTGRDCGSGRRAPMTAISQGWYQEDIKWRSASNFPPFPLRAKTS